MPMSPVPAAGGVQDGVGQLPAHLLRELVAHRLLALDAVGLLERRALVPAVLLRPLGAHTARVGDEAVHGLHVRAVGRGLHQEEPGDVAGDEHVGLHPAPGGVGRERAARVPRGRKADLARPQRLGHRHGESEAAGLEGPGGVARLVLDEEAGKAHRRAELGSGQEGSEALPQRDAVLRILDGQHFPIAPESGLSQREVAGPHVVGRALEVVAGEEGAPHSQRFRTWPGGYCRSQRVQSRRTRGTPTLP